MLMKMVVIEEEGEKNARSREKERRVIYALFGCSYVKQVVWNENSSYLSE